MKTSKALLFLATLLAGSLLFGQAVKITKGPVVEHAGSTDAVIAWSTNTAAATILKYGTDPQHLDRTAQMPWGGLTHRVTIKHLQPGTTYYFQADSSQGQGTGTAATSGVDRFTTEGGQQASGRRGEARPELKMIDGPRIEHVGSRDAQIAWTTDLPSSSIVKFGTNPNRLSQTAEQPWGATTHRVQLKNLRPNTRYFFSVHSAQGRNAPGQAVDTPPQVFTTAAGQRADGDHDSDDR